MEAKIDWSKLPKANERGEHATARDAELVRAAQLYQASIVNAGGDPFADEAPTGEPE